MAAHPEPSAPIVVLGGYGPVGRRLSRLLCQSTHNPVIVAGRRMEAAAQLAGALASEHPQARISARYADADIPATVTAVAAGCRILVIACPLADRARKLAAACLAVGCDYLDMGGASGAVEAVQGLQQEAARVGRLLVVQAGFCPGLPAVLIRRMCDQLEGCRAIHVGVSISLKKGTPPEQIYGLADAAAESRPLLFRDGKWRCVNRAAERRQFDYGPAIGTRTSLLFDLPELHDLPETLGLEELAAFGATPEWRLECAFRAAAGALYRLNRKFGRAVTAGLLRGVAARSVHRGLCGMVVNGWSRSGRHGTLRLSHPEPADLTAAAVSLFLRHYLAGEFRSETGVRFMGHLLDPEGALRAMAALGAGAASDSPPARPGQAEAIVPGRG